MSWKTFPQELLDLADCLGKQSVTEPTANALQTLRGSFANSWRANRSLRTGTGIQIPPPRDKALHPQSCEIVGAEMAFVFELGDKIDEIPMPAQSDFQVCVRGRVEYHSAEVELEDHWRVDTQMGFSGDKPWEPHPKVHFQRGGHAQDAFVQHPSFLPSAALPANAAGAWRSLLQSPGPRVPFPPSCPILAIDYVIGQHDGRVHRRLRENPEYRAIVTRAQRRLWVPFFEKLAENNDLRRSWLGDLLSDA